MKSIPMSRRLFIDHTHTTQYGFQTGVQRVVRKICEHAKSAGEGRFEQVIPVMLNELGFGPSDIQPFTTVASQRTPERKRFGNGFRRWMRKSKRWLRGQVHPKNQMPNLVTNCCGDIDERDTLLLPDAYWALPSVWPAVKRFRNAGGHTAIVIYDLIPHTHSDIYGADGADCFRNYVRAAFEHADRFYAISRTVRDQLVVELPRITGMPLGDFGIDYFELGAEFTDPAGTVQASVADIFIGDEPSRPLLMVGTIEARKNHQFVIDTMERMWLEAPERRLCVVGRPGWKGDIVIDRIQSHSRYKKQLFWVDNAADSDLLHCYKNSKGVVFSSLAEGFGLPIVEALWHRCNTFVSDIPIHREVGKNRCHYFDLKQPDSLLKLLRQFEVKRYANDNNFESTQVHVPPTSWSESVAGLVEKIHVTSLCHKFNSKSVIQKIAA